MSAIEHDDRPWGCYDVLSDEADSKVKRITVTPGCRLSYQRHRHRSEHWFIVSGTAVVTLEGVDKPMEPGDAVDIPVGTAHRITSLGPDRLVFIEVQHGTSFGEDDIERLEDDYGR